MALAVKPKESRVLQIRPGPTGPKDENGRLVERFEVVVDDSEEGLLGLGAKEMIDLLREWSVGMQFWRDTAMEFKRAGKVAECEEVFKAAIKEIERGAFTDPHKVTLLVGYAGYMYDKYISTDEKAYQEDARSLLARAEMHNRDVQFNPEIEVLRGVFQLRDYYETKKSYNWQEAVGHFETVLQMRPKNLPARLGKAAALMLDKKFAEASAIYTEVVQGGFEKLPPAVLLCQAFCYQQLGRTDASMKLVEHLRKQNPNDVDANCFKAGVLANRPDGIEESIKLIEKNLSDFGGGDHPVVHAQLGQKLFFQDKKVDATTHLTVARRDTSSKTIKAGAAYFLGRMRHAEGSYREAYDLYHQCHDELNDHLPCKFALAKAAFALDKTREATVLLEEVLQKAPKNDEVLRLAVLVFRNDPARNEQVEGFLKQMAIEDDDLEGWRLRASTFVQVGRMDHESLHGALAAYEKVKALLSMKEEEPDIEMLSNMGSLYTTAGHFDKAKESLDKAMERIQAEMGPDPQKATGKLKALDMTVKFNQALLLEEKRPPVLLEARHLYKKIIKISPHYVDAYARIARQDFKRGDYGKALEYLDGGLENNPNNVELLTMRAEVHRKSGNTDEALRDASLAAKVDPGDNAASMLVAHLKYIKACIFSSMRKVYPEEKRDAQAARAAAAGAEALLREALDTYKEVLKRDRTAYAAELGIGAIFAHKGKRNEAMTVMKSLQENLYEPAEVDLAVNCGHLMMAAGEDVKDARAYEKAVTYYSRAFELNSEDPDIITFLAIAYFKQNRLSDAERVLNWGLFLYPSDPRLLWNHTNLQEKIGMEIFLSKDDKAKANLYRKEHVERGQKILQGAQRRYEFIKKLVEEEEHPPGPDEDKAATHRTSTVIVEGIEALKQAHRIEKTNIKESIESHLQHCQNTLAIAQGWYEQLIDLERKQNERKREEARRKREEEEREREKKEQEEQDEMRKRRARNERAENLTQQIANTALPEVSEKPRVPGELGPPLAPRGQKRPAEDPLGDARRSAQPRVGEGEGETMMDLFGLEEDDELLQPDAAGDAEPGQAEAAGDAEAGENENPPPKDPEPGAETDGDLLGSDDDLF